MRVHHGTIARIGDYIYASSGDFGPSFFTAINVKNGTIAYQDRTFPKINFVLADGKFIILDEDGNLALATASPTELKVISKGECFEEPCLDRADARRNKTVPARPADDHGA